MSTIVVKHGSQTSTEVLGIYRARDIPLPEVGDEVLIVRVDIHLPNIELPGFVIGVNEKERTYDIRFLNAEPMEGGDDEQ